MQLTMIRHWKKSLKTVLNDIYERLIDMAEEKKGITVKIDADLHAQVSEYIKSKGMTMGEFISLACDDILHPKYEMRKDSKMENTRTIAIQVPEDLFQRIKEYLQRNNMSQKQFLVGLIEDELDREQMELKALQEIREENAKAAVSENDSDDSENQESTEKTDAAEYTKDNHPEDAPDAYDELDDSEENDVEESESEYQDQGMGGYM